MMDILKVQIAIALVVAIATFDGRSWQDMETESRSQLGRSSPGAAALASELGDWG